MFYFPNKPIRVYDPERICSVLGHTGWVVQPKWNGKRAMVSCTETGRVSLFSRQGVAWPHEQWPWLADLPLGKPWFLDGELLRDGRIFIWDFAVLAGNLEIRTPYGDRLAKLKQLVDRSQNSGCFIEVVETRPAEEYKVILGGSADPMLEGVVWKNLAGTDFWGPHRTTEVASQFKYRIR